MAACENQTDGLEMVYLHLYQGATHPSKPMTELSTKTRISFSLWHLQTSWLGARTVLKNYSRGWCAQSKHLQQKQIPEAAIY